MKKTENIYSDKADASNLGNCGNCTDNPLVCSILESISDGVFTVDQDWKITSFNRAAQEITGVSKENALGRPCWEVFRADACESSCPLRRTLKNGKPIINRMAYIINSAGQRIPVSLSTAILKDENGNIIGGAETFRDLSIEQELKEQLEGGSREIVTHSRAMQEILGMLPDVAGSDANVVVRGETGTGKELLARAIHELSPRRERPFVAVNCGALPDNLLESELFGYKKGAFTDAKSDKPGRFALAEGGTIFLDEIGDISPALQVKLLRVLQEKAYEPLGGTKTVKTDVRVIAATHRDLEKMMEEETFRTDLYYRINVVTLDLPPLRKRQEDIALLADHFIRKFNHLRGVNLAGLSPEALEILQSHSFPGNVRELENMIERAYVLCHAGEILPSHLPSNLTTSPVDHDNQLQTGKGILVSSARETEEKVILSALQKHRYNRIAAAEELGIHKSTLHRKIRTLKLILPEQDGRSRHR